MSPKLRGRNRCADGQVTAPQQERESVDDSPVVVVFRSVLTLALQSSNGDSPLVD